MGMLNEGQRLRFTPLQQPRGLKAVDLMPGE